ncbi:MAG: DUF433 domain-containing protein [Anaerolineaceae bacterium]
MTALVGIENLITIDPEERDGSPLITGTGVSVCRIATLAAEGLSAEEIVRDVFDNHLSHAQVYAAPAFYHANRPAIDAELVARESEHDRLWIEHSSKRHAS